MGRKKIKFPLEMKKGKQVRKLREFQEYFDLEKAAEYFFNGKLQIWLENTYNDDILEDLNKLNGDEKDFAKQFIKALGVKCEIREGDIWEAKRKASVGGILKRELKEEEVDKAIKAAARNQHELEELINLGMKDIYIIGSGEKIDGDTDFSKLLIRKEFNNIHLTGINQPIIEVEESNPLEFKNQQIFFSDLGKVKFADEKTKKVVSADGWNCVVYGVLDVIGAWLKQVE